MFPVFARLLTRFVPILTLPVALVIGAIGYVVESNFSNRHTPYEETSIQDKRSERLLKNLDETSEDRPSNIFNQNDRNKLK